MEPHLSILVEDQIPDDVIWELENSIRVPGLLLKRETRAYSVPFAGVEWLMPTVVVAYVAKPYFESFLKEMGKDHYDLLKKGFNKLYKHFVGPRATTVEIVSAQGKSCTDQQYSLFFSIVAETPDGVRLKLLLPQPIAAPEYEIAVSKFLDLVQSTYTGAIDELAADAFKNAPIVGGTVLVTYDSATGQLVPLDPLLGRRPP